MTIKEKLLDYFMNDKGRYTSGEELAKKFGCTRGAIWKAVKILQNEGYDISAVTNKGYSLARNNDVISESGINKYLCEKNIYLNILKKTDSTNSVLRNFAMKGSPEGTVVISGEQTSGRGRLGRNFFSPSDTGIYISILLRPDMSASDAAMITTAAAVSVAEAIEEVSGKETGIKWVNDIYISGKKICGILTEASVSLEAGGLEYAVLGIGINVYTPDDGFPADIADIAGAIFEERESDMRNRIIAALLNNFFGYYRCLKDRTYIENYRKRLLWKGSIVNIISSDKKIPVKLIDVDDECRLIVNYSDGSSGLVNSGEISIRK